MATLFYSSSTSSFCVRKPGQMSIINYIVYSKSRKSMLFPWNIDSVQTPTLTFRQHYMCDVRPHCLQLFPDIQCDLEEVYVGTEKERVDVVDPRLWSQKWYPFSADTVWVKKAFPTSLRFGSVSVLFFFVSVPFLFRFVFKSFRVKCASVLFRYVYVPGWGGLRS